MYNPRAILYTLWCLTTKANCPYTNTKETEIDKALSDLGWKYGSFEIFAKVTLTETISKALRSES